MVPSDSIIKKIVADIAKEKCVLIVGPDIVDFGEGSFFEVLCSALEKDGEFNHLVDINPQYIFAHEELFQLKSDSNETQLLRYIEDFYEKQTQYNEPFRKISHIPFNLVISMLPDGRLKDIYEKQSLKFEYGYYPREGKRGEITAKTNKESPLIYNLLGDLSEGSFIITFDHLFKYLSGIMRDGLPDAIQATLKSARSFIFLGVHFERWYVQLLLKIITTSGKEKYSILRNSGNDEVFTFIAKRFALTFEESEPVDFLDELYRECDNQNLLKGGSKAKVFISYNHGDKEIVDRIIGYLKQNDITVIIDNESMDAGQKIEKFIEVINQVDCVLAVISANSLRSKWVGKEIITTLGRPDKFFLPCHIDDTSMDGDFIQRTDEYIDQKTTEINEKIKTKGFTVDLITEGQDWTNHKNSLPAIINSLTRTKYISLKPGDFDENIKVATALILKDKKNRS